MELWGETSADNRLWHEPKLKHTNTGKKSFSAAGWKRVCCIKCYQELKCRFRFFCAWTIMQAMQHGGQNNQGEGQDCSKGTTCCSGLYFLMHQKKKKKKFYNENFAPEGSEPETCDFNEKRIKSGSLNSPWSFFKEGFNKPRLFTLHPVVLRKEAILINRTIMSLVPTLL